MENKTFGRAVTMKILLVQLSFLGDTILSTPVIAGLKLIYPNAKSLAKNVIAKDGTIAIRVVKDEFCQKVIAKLGKPIVSTSANFTGETSPVMFKDISDELIRQVDYVVPINQDKLSKTKASTIIKLKLNGEFEIVRQ